MEIFFIRKEAMVSQRTQRLIYFFLANFAYRSHLFSLSAFAVIKNPIWDGDIFKRKEAKVSQRTQSLIHFFLANFAYRSNLFSLSAFAVIKNLILYGDLFLNT
jgi:hypothetical protein